MSGSNPDTILIVDDEAIIALAEKRTLERYGYSVLTASSGEGALEMLGAGIRIDLVLMDINLGSGMDGTRAALEILEKHDLPLVFLSSHTEREVVEKTEGITSYGYIHKNSGETVLVAAIKMAFKLSEKSAALRESERKYRHLIENSHDIIYTLTRDGFFSFVSNAWTTLLGHPVSGVLGRSFKEFVHPDDLPACLDWFKRMIGTGQALKSIEYRVHHNDGSWRWHRSEGLPLTDPSGQVLGLEGIAADITERKQVEAAVQAERNLAQMYLDVAGTLFVVIDSKGLVTLINRRGCEILGCRREDILGRNWIDVFIPPASASDVHRVFHSVMDGMFEPVEYYENSVIDAKGREHYIAWHNTVLRDAEGHVVGSLSSGDDISERKRTEDALAESENKLKSVFDAIDESICFLERDGTILAANTTFAARLGRTVEECLGVDAFSLLPPDTVGHRRVCLEEVFLTGEPRSFEDSRGGRWIHQTLYPVVDAGGRTSRVVIYATDITEQKRAQDAERVSATLYSTIFQAVPIGLTISDTEGKILKNNPPASRMLGLSEEEHAKRAIDSREWRIIRKDGSPMPSGEYASTLALKEKRLVENVEMGIVKDTDDIVWINVSAAPVPLAGYGVVIAYNDISKRVRAERQVETLLREKDLVLKEAHHRVKNNLGAISSLLHLQAESQDNEALANILNDATGRVQSMMVLYDKLYRSDRFTDLGIKDYLADLIDQVMALYEARHKVRAELQVDDFQMEAKKLATLGIIINELITNSMKYAFRGSDRGLITVSAFKKRSRVAVRYADDGPGLPATLDFDNSTGFGMKLISLLVQQLAGTIRMESGKGVCIVIEFEL